MDQISVVDKIRFHRKTSEVQYHDILQSILSNKNHESKEIKLEEQLKKEKAIEKSWQTQIKKLEVDLMEMGVKPDNKKPAKKLLEEKDKTISSLKKQLKICVVDHPQMEELLTFQEEANSLQQSTLDLKARILQLESEKESLQKEKSELLHKTITTGIEKPQKISTDELKKYMSQVSLKDDEIKKIKEKNGQIDQENNFLREKVAKQKNKLKGKLQLQGAKHLLWDQINVEVDNLWEYMNYIEYKRSLEDSTLTKCKAIDKVFQQRPINKDQSAIKLLKQASNESLRILGVKDICSIFIWAKKFIEKHNMKANVNAKVEQMQKEVQHFKETFKELFEKGLPSFWDNNGKMILEEKL